MHGLSTFDTTRLEMALPRGLQHRVGDERVIRLVRKWLKAGVLDDGKCSVSEEGAPQKAVNSPLLVNVYLHCVFERRAHQFPCPSLRIPLIADTHSRLIADSVPDDGGHLGWGA